MTNHLKTIIPYENESDVLSLGELTLENRTDRISIYGSIDITRDTAGLQAALTLQANLNAIVGKLQSEHLPEKIEAAPTKTVSNPFEPDTK